MSGGGSFGGGLFGVFAAEPGPDGGVAFVTPDFPVKVVLFSFLTGVVAVGATQMGDGAGEGDKGFEGFDGGRDGNDRRERRRRIGSGIGVVVIRERGIRGDGPFGEGDGEAGGEELGGAVGHETDGFFEVAGEVVGFAGTFEEVFAGLPLGETALAPLGEVLGNDRVSVEEFMADFLNFGQGVEPIDEGDAGNVAFEAVIEFLTDFVRETGDFSVSCHGGLS